jgi:rfaE bifunctional protein kinase chain/domain
VTTPEIEKLFASFNEQTVLLIGDSMIDAYLWGNVTRQSPEAPVPVVAVYQQEKRLGGAGNVAINLKALGARTILCAFVGNDDNGLTVRELLADNELEDHGLFEVSDRPTTVKTRIIAHNKHVLRIDEEVTEELHDYHPFIGMVTSIIEKTPIDVILFQDYDKGVIHQTVIDAVVSLANKKGIPTIVDPKMRNFMHYKGVTLFKPNLKEIKEGLGVPINARDDDELRTNVALLRERLDASMALITLSELGVFIQHPGGEQHMPAFERQIVDVSGAGDTVVSVAALCLAAGSKPETIAMLANLAGGLVCEEVGVVPIDKSRLLKEAIKQLR